MSGSRLGKCSSKRSLSLIYLLELNGSRVHKVVVGMMNASGDGRLRGIETDRKRVRIEKKRVERKLGGEKGDFLVFWFVFNPPKKPCPFFSTTPHKENPFSNSS